MKALLETQVAEDKYNAPLSLCIGMKSVCWDAAPNTKNYPGLFVLTSY